jgi:hypothetical protein
MSRDQVGPAVAYCFKYAAAAVVGAVLMVSVMSMKHIWTTADQPSQIAKAQYDIRVQAELTRSIARMLGVDVDRVEAKVRKQIACEAVSGGG